MIITVGYLLLAGAATPAAPQSVNEWRVDRQKCPDGVILVPDGKDTPRCIPCDEVEQQQPMNRCAGLRHKKADAELHRRYQALLKSFPKHRGALRRAERAWIKDRDAACEKDKNGEGTISPMLYARCLHDKTRQRIDELEDLRRRWTQEKAAPRKPNDRSSGPMH